MKSKMKKVSDVRDFTYSPNGHVSGKRFLPDVKSLLIANELPFVCDAPTEALGNCFLYALMQQLNRSNVHSSLSEEMKILSQNYFELPRTLGEGVLRRRGDPKKEGFIPLCELCTLDISVPLPSPHPSSLILCFVCILNVVL